MGRREGTASSSPQPSSGSRPTRSGGRRLYGPYTHQINKGGLSEIETSGQLIATYGRWGDCAVRASEHPLRRVPAGQREVIEFYTHEKPDYVHQGNGEVYWYRKEDDRVAILLTRIALPGEEFKVLRQVDRSGAQ